MYLRFETHLEFPKLAQKLCADLNEDALNWDYENVYEWMYVDLPHLDFSLNISRVHGLADVDDEILDHYRHDEHALKEIVKPGPIYVHGWDQRTSDYVDQLPDSLANFIAERLSVAVSVFNHKINIDLPDGEPIKVVTPQNI